MQDFEKSVIDAEDIQKLNELKSFLLKENIRLKMLEQDLEDKTKQFENERENLQTEMKILHRKINSEKNRIKADRALLDKKTEFIKQELVKLKYEYEQLERDKASAKTLYIEDDHAKDLFFAGVKGPLSLKKRYKELMKIYHPDNVAGDEMVVRMIRDAYENSPYRNT